MSRLRAVVTALRADRERTGRWVLTALIAVGTLIRLPQLLHGLTEAFAFRQTQTAFTVREYGEHGINLFTTPLPLFGPEASVPMEFPLFQGIASLLVPLGVPAEVASRTLALVSFEASAVLLAILLLRWHGRAVAVVAIALFEFLPYGLLWGAASLIDFMSVALALLMVLGLDTFFRRRSIPWLVVASVAAVTGFLVKITTMPSYGILLLVAAVLVIREFGWSAAWRRLLVGFAAAPGLGLAVGAAWTVYADRVKGGNEMTAFLTSSALRQWNFGTLTQRLDEENYLKLAVRVASDIAGPGLATIVLAIIAAIYLRSHVQRAYTVGWLLVALSAPLVFFNLYLQHNYYLIAIYPALVAAIAIGGVWLVRTIPGSRYQRGAVGVAFAAILVVTTALTPLGRADIMQFVNSNPQPGVSSLLLDQTEPGDNIIMIGCDWDPTFLYYGHRDGVMFRETNPGGFWQNHDIDDYPYLFSCRADLDPNSYLPAGYTATAKESAGFYAVAPTP